ncbi:hypothetical protein JZC87_003745 [Salmonella enterica subsp. enterica serovar Enteritidis]|nr:hypothetical protein [Salmonella enterica subsp. enterica serovar Enteritidis]EHI2089202.1 hypothetical protein [Salmonella enterica]EHB3018696.1 hypothetical protein [Salmonella enterica subsp. enterica serovar Enteritidis]EHE1086781.1 hypothetical protein [Salmonella enterica subsp. enterica serovar Enteritidis]EHE1107830.1 hypothetical protein [Salmonella enterica subsp. enterica serovar Enteritidis]
MQRLSLLARGTRLHAKIPVVGARFIPAGAGNTQERAAEELGVCGLSPLARGTRCLSRSSGP